MLTACQRDRNESRSTWDDWKIRLQKRSPKAFNEKTASDLEGLSLPVPTTANHGANNADIWKELSYKYFVEQLQRKNPDTVLTKLTTDSAFRFVVDRVKIRASSRESCIARVSHSVRLNA